MTDNKPGRRTRSGKRTRQRERPTPQAPAYITRRIPTYDLLSEEGLVQIEQTAERILADVGMEFRGDDEALHLWRKAGAEVDGVRVRFPPCLLQEALSTAPSEFTNMPETPTTR